MTTFDKLGILKPILSALTDCGYEVPTLIQEKAIPAGLAGRDVLGSAQTGTGKTCAFGVPILQRLNKAGHKKDRIRALILTPTRELAIQIDDNLKDYGKNLPLKEAVIFGGVGQAPQVEQIKKASGSIAVFYSGNMSLGINLLIELSKQAAKVLGNEFDIEIVEKHHNLKVDAPSGTALMIADGISGTLENEPQYVYDRHSYRRKRSKNEIGIHSVRGGTIVGEHEVIFAGHDEVVTITHQAQSKEVFAVGAVNAAVYLSSQGAGMYNMGNLLSSIL